MGPTASGKTALALALCDRFDCEIISVDSAQVYRGMDIGTAKPSRATQARYPHRLIDIRDPAESYSAADFRRDALRAIARDHRARPHAAAGGRHDALFPRAARRHRATCRRPSRRFARRFSRWLHAQGWARRAPAAAAVDPASQRRAFIRTIRSACSARWRCIMVSGRPLSELHRDNCELSTARCLAG